jgi:hypothetical protein
VSRTRGVHARDYVVHRVSLGDPDRTRCGRPVAKVNVTRSDREVGEGICKACGWVPSESVQVGSRVVVKMDLGSVVGVVDSIEPGPNGQMALRADGGRTLVGFRRSDVLDVLEDKS